MPVFLLSVSLWLLSALVVQLGTVIVVFVVVSKDTALCGNFLGVFKNTFFKEALESYLGRELGQQPALGVPTGGNMLGRAAACTGFSPWQIRAFPSPTGTLRLVGEDGPCCLVHQFSGAWDVL